MNQRFLLFVFGTILLFILNNCDQKEALLINKGSVEFYLLESFETTGDHYFQIDEASVITEARVFLEYVDLLSYNPDTHFFTISENARNKIENLDHSVHGIPFGIYVNNELIYTGYFWPGYSSMSCDWIVIDPLTLWNDNRLKVNLGYAASIQMSEIPDRRNDPRILSVFRADNKLVK